MLKKVIEKLRQGILREILMETQWIYRYAASYNKWIALYILLGLVSAAIGLGSGVTSKYLIDAVISRSGAVLLPLAVCYVLAQLAGVVLSALISRLTAKVSTSAANEIRADVFSRFLDVDWQASLDYHSGDLLSRVNGDAATVAGSVLGWIPSLITGTARLCGALTAILWYDPVMALLALLGAPVMALLSRVFLTRMREFGKKTREAQAEMVAFYEEALQNLQAVKAFDLKAHHKNRLDTLQENCRNVTLEYNQFSVKSNLLMSGTGVVVSCLCLGWGVFRLWNDAVSFGTVMLFVQLAGMVTSAFNSLVSLVPSAVSATVSARRIMTILALPMEATEKSPEAEAVLERAAEAGVSVRVESVSFAYQQDADVFENLSLHAEPGEIVGVVGPSGEGKTTLIRMLLGLISPAEGRIRFQSGGSGADFEPCLRRLVAYVAQEKVSFSGTIADSLRLVRPDAADEQLQDALRMACAWEFVSRLPNGMYSTLGERGSGLSEGQLQRLAIARALLSEATVLLMDEATSALDYQTERKLLANILSASQRRTVIVTTHRPAMLKNCTRVYEIQDKRVRCLSPDEIRAYVADALL